MISTVPNESVERKPNRSAIFAASGPAPSCASAVGIITSPAAVTDSPKP